MKRKGILLAIFLLPLPVLLGSEPPDDTSSRLEVRLSTEQPEVFQRVEILVHGVPPADNPFDPDTITVDLSATGPSGKISRVPGFYHQEFERRLQGKREILSARGGHEWRIRWLPLEAGRHILRVSVIRAGRPGGQVDSAIEVRDADRRGIVQVDPEGKRYFRTSPDKKPLFLNGLCACWHDNRGTYDYDDWLDAYQKAGINYIRIWMWHHAFGIEWDRQDRLQYRLDNAWRLDRVLAEAERRGIYVMLCFDYHGVFEVKPDFWGGNNFWPRHPYNALNGGPCQTQNEFFTSAEAKRLYEKRLRYMVGRWSAFPNVLAWEFFNEIDNEYAYVRHEDVVRWHRDMARALRRLDPLGHLISSSFTGGSERPDLFALPEMDFAQYHSYNEKFPAQMTAQKAARFFEKYEKPFFVSEYGTDWRGWKPDTDPHFRALHQAIWSGVFTGSAGTSMTWWWQNIHTANLYHHWSALTAFLEGTGVGRPDLKPAKFQNTAENVLVFGVAAPDEALVWLLDPKCNWPNGATNVNPEPINGITVTLAGIDDGSWAIEWWDTAHGKCVAQEQETSSEGKLRLTPPPFRVDLAARLRIKQGTVAGPAEPALW